MALIANKRSIMTLYSEAMDIYCHQVRIVLAEKGVSVDIVNINAAHYPTELAELNPYNTIPTLVDRDLVLYQARIIIEYLDERFPHPPLLPVYPVARAKCRLYMHRVQHDWYAIANKIDVTNLEACQEHRKELHDSLVSTTSIFEQFQYFLSDDFSLVDCYLAPLLWRLPLYGIELPKQAKAIHQYMDRVYSRDAFQASLSEAERDIASQIDI